MQKGWVALCVAALAACESRSDVRDSAECDVDRDGHRSVLCGGADCDDGDPMAFPGAAEDCNGRDDDCDGVIDGPIRESGAPATVLPTARRPTWVWTIDGPDGLALAYGDAAEARFEIIDSIAPRRESSPLEPAAPVEVGRDATGRDRELAIRLGCPMRTFRQPRRECSRDVDCLDEICVAHPDGRSYCESRLAVAPMPEGCTSHASCDDTTFCNGTSFCRPEDPGLGDTRQCTFEVSEACPASDSCDEERNGCVEFAVSECSIAHLAVAPLGDGTWLAPFVSTSGCAAGVARLGYFAAEPREPAYRYPHRQILQRGDDRRTRSWTGLDVPDVYGGPLHCTGGSRPSGEPIGATGIAVATIEANPGAARRRPQGLVGWLAAPLCRGGTCLGDPGGSGPVDIELVGAWLEETSLARIAWVSTTSDGTPVRVGRAAAGITQPAIARVGDRYAVVYPRDGGGIAFHLVPALEDPSPSCPAAGSTCVRSEAPYETFVGLLGADRITPALSVPDASVRLEDRAVTGDVVVAIASADRGAIAWVENSSIGFATVTFGATDVSVGAPAMIGLRDGARELSIAHIETGVAAGSDRSGYVIVWSNASGTFATRFATDGSPIDPNAIRLGGTSLHPRAFLERSGDRPVVRVLAHADSGFVTFPGICEAPSY